MERGPDHHRLHCSDLNRSGERYRHAHSSQVSMGAGLQSSKGDRAFQQRKVRQFGVVQYRSR